MSEIITVDHDVFVGIKTVSDDGSASRRILDPGRIVDGIWVDTDISGESDAVKSVCNQLWTPAAVDGYRSSLMAVYRTPSESDYKNAIQCAIDQVAQSHNYADGGSLAGYKDSTVPLWAAEASAFIAWRDVVWTYAYQTLASVQSGSIPPPSIGDLISGIIPITWPSS